jgi:hypothetical protein
MFILTNLTNSKRNQTDYETESITQISYFIKAFLMSIGIMGNFINLFILAQKRFLRKKFNWYLLVSTIFELIFCLIIFIDYLFSFNYSHFLHEFNTISRIIIDFSVHTSDSCIGILTLFLSLDRLYAIKYPLDIKEYFTNLHAKLTIGLSLLILIILNILSYSLCEMNIFTDVHIVYCALVSPLIFNTIPLIIIFCINLILVYEIVIYYKKKQSNGGINRSNHELVSTSIELIDLRKNETSIRKTMEKNLSLYQKSHYLVILVSALWSVLTSIPYYSFKSFFLLTESNILKTDFSDSEIYKIQIVSSIFFNFNHCINFFIYISFYDDFRQVLRNLIPEF